MRLQRAIVLCAGILMALPLTVKQAAGQPAAATGSADTPLADGRPAPLTILVADPLAKELACDCVAGYAQRRYEALAMVLEKRLKRPVISCCGTTLSAYWGDDQSVSLIVGKHSDVMYQAQQMGRKVYPIASLTDRQGKTTFQGLFVVRSGNRARSINDLQGYRIILGPASCDEKHSAAIAALKKAHIEVAPSDERTTVPSCTDAANELIKLQEDDKAVAIISDYAKVLLEGCHAIPKDALRVIGSTEPLPFVTVFATDELSPGLRRTIQQELLASKRFPTLLRLLESRDGFQRLQLARDTTSEAGWTDFRGANRDAIVAQLPKTLDGMRLAWSAPLSGRGLGGTAVTSRWVLATDRGEETRMDYLKMFDVRTGELRFTGDLVEPTGYLHDKKLDYGNSVRTTPVVVDEQVYILDAFGAFYSWHLPDSDSFAPSQCINGTSTALLVEDFQLLTWGLSSTPLVTTTSGGGTQVILNSCSAAHTLLAVDADSLSVQWLGAGSSSGYASCIVGTFGGREQVVGYDRLSLGGWDLHTGARIWTVSPEIEGDFNVPTPIALDDQRLLVVTESNGMRIYEFDQQGVLRDEPIAMNEDVVNDTVTPVVVAGKAYCTSEGALYQLDTRQQLKTLWTMADKAFNGHVSLIADRQGHRLLVTTYQGELLLFDISRMVPELISRQHAYGPEEHEEIYAHPSLVGNRLYLRGLRSLICIEL